MVIVGDIDTAAVLKVLRQDVVAKGKSPVPLWEARPETASRLLQSAASQFAPPLQKALREGLARYLQSSLPDACLAQVVAVLAKVDADENMRIAGRHQARGFPTVIAYSHGVEIDRFHSAQ